MPEATREYWDAYLDIEVPNETDGLYEPCFLEMTFSKTTPTWLTGQPSTEFVIDLHEIERIKIELSGASSEQDNKIQFFVYLPYGEYKSLKGSLESARVLDVGPPVNLNTGETYYIAPEEDPR